jgi:hypothetical protein
MRTSTWSWRLICAAGVILGVCLAGPSRADEKGKKDSDKGKADKNVIVIQLDLSKAPPAFVKQLMELAKSQAKDEDEKKDGKKKDKGKKSDKDDEKGRDKKSNIVQVDLNKLPPDLAKRLKAELAKSKDDGKKSSKKDEDDDDEKGGKGKGGKDEKKGGKKKGD